MPPLIEHAIPAFVLLMAVEAIAGAIMRRELYEIKDSAASITMGLGNVAVSLLTKTMQLALFSWLYRASGFSAWATGGGFGCFCFLGMRSATTGFIARATNAAFSGHRTWYITPPSAITSRPRSARAGREHSRAGSSGCGSHGWDFLR